MSLLVDEADPDVVFAGAFNGVWRSTDGAHTWTRLREVGWGVFAIARDPSDPSRFLAATGSGGVLRSEDGGATWKPSNRGLTYDPAEGIGSVAFDPTGSRSFVGTRGGDGVAVSHDGGRSWSPSNDGLSARWISSVATGPGDRVLAGESGPATMWTSLDEGATWADSTPESRGYAGVDAIVVHPRRPGVVATLADRTVSVTFDGGTTWTGFEVPYSWGFPHLVRDPFVPSTLYLAGEGLLRSSDGGRTWRRRSPVDPWGTLGTLVADPGDRGRLFALAHGGVIRSDDGGTSWRHLHGPRLNSILDGMAIAPEPPFTLYLAVDAHVWRTSDGGLTWRHERTGVVDADMIAVDPTDAQVVYAAGYDGVIASTDGGVTWTSLGQPPGRLLGLTVSTDGGTLYVATSGGVAAIHVG
jgi:photosystem II stability/assembly factor-like uncharacterized protein